MYLTVERSGNLEGTVKAPPSKSYTHRAVIIAALAEGVSEIRDPLVAEDTLSSLNACRAFGVRLMRVKPGPSMEAEGNLKPLMTLSILGTLAQPSAS